MSDTTVNVRPSGPYLIKGSFEILDPDGTPYQLDSEMAALCRCGQSSNKPFCDGTHKSIEFVAEERAES